MDLLLVGALMSVWGLICYFIGYMVGRNNG